MEYFNRLGPVTISWVVIHILSTHPPNFLSATATKTIGRMPLQFIDLHSTRPIQIGPRRAGSAKRPYSSRLLRLGSSTWWMAGGSDLSDWWPLWTPILRFIGHRQIKIETRPARSERQNTEDREPSFSIHSRSSSNASQAQERWHRIIHTIFLSFIPSEFNFHSKLSSYLLG